MKKTSILLGAFSAFSIMAGVAQADDSYIVKGHDICDYPEVGQAVDSIVSNAKVIAATDKSIKGGLNLPTLFEVAKDQQDFQEAGATSAKRFWNLLAYPEQLEPLKLTYRYGTEEGHAVCKRLTQKDFRGVFTPEQP